MAALRSEANQSESEELNVCILSAGDPGAVAHPPLAATNQDRRSDNDPIVCFFIFTAAVALDCSYADLK
jgi:hypothetical protein